jgi:hypothetical protein
MAPVAPKAYILHLDGDRRGGVPSDNIPLWQEQHHRSIGEIITRVSPEKLCIETLDYPFDLVEDIIDRMNLSICLDIGHLLLYRCDVDHYLENYLKRTRVIHMHGIENGRDHRDISFLDSSFLENLYKHLTGEDIYTGVITIEVFNQTDFEGSLRTIRKCWHPAVSGTG